MSYYYFGATLPSLSLTAALPWSLAEFVAEAARQLTAADRNELAAVLEGSGQSAFARGDQQRQQDLAVAVARRRAERRGLDPAAVGAVADRQLGQAVDEAFAAADPLERERRLDLVRWRWLESRAEQEPFALTAVLAHALRLQIAERWQGRQPAIGREQFAVQRQRLLAGFADLQLTAVDGLPAGAAGSMDSEGATA